MIEAARSAVGVKTKGGGVEDQAADADAAIRAVYGNNAVKPEPDWSDISAYLDQPEEDNKYIKDIGIPVDVASEKQALELIQEAFGCSLETLRKGDVARQGVGMELNPPNPVLIEMIKAYREGQSMLLKAACTEARRLRGFLC